MSEVPSREEWVELERLSRREDLRAVLALPSGRRLVWRLLRPVFAPSYAGGNEAVATAYNEGRRAGALELMAEVQRDARASYLEMVKEAVAALPPEALE